MRENFPLVDVSIFSQDIDNCDESENERGDNFDNKEIADGPLILDVSPTSAYAKCPLMIQLDILFSLAKLASGESISFDKVKR